MVNILSVLTAVVVYSRLYETGHSTAAAIIVGTAIGVLIQQAFKLIKKSAEGGASNGQNDI